METREPGVGHPPQLEDLIDRSKSNTARRQHLVPAFYLRGWADEDGIVRVSDKAVPVTYCKKPEKVARVSNFYTLETEPDADHPFPPLFAETLNAEIERWAAPHISQLRSDTPEVSPEGLLALVWFLAIQTTRGQVTRDAQRLDRNPDTPTRMGSRFRRSHPTAPAAERIGGSDRRGRSRHSGRPR